MRYIRFVLLFMAGFTSLTLVSSQNIPFTDLEVITSSNIDQLEQLLMINRGPIEEMSWSPDNRKLAVVGAAGGWIYDVDDLQAEPIHFAQFMRVKDLDFHPSGNRIITTGDAGAVYEWDIETGRMIRAIAPEPYNLCPNCQAAASTVKYSLDGTYIAVGSTNGAMLLLDSETGNILANLPAERPYEIFFSPDGRYIAAHDSVTQTRVSVWSVSSLLDGLVEAAYVSQEAPFAIWNIAWMPDSQGILLAPFSSDPSQLFIFDLPSATLQPYASGHHVVATNSSYATTRKGVYNDQEKRWVISISILDIATKEMIWQFEVEGRLTDLRFSPSGQYLAISFEDGSMQIADVETMQQHGSIIGSGASIRAVQLLDNEYLVSMDIESYDVATLTSGGACGVSTLRLWNLTTAREVRAWRSDIWEIGRFACTNLIALQNSRQVVLQSDSDIIVLDPFTDEHFRIALPFVGQGTSYNFQFELSLDQNLLGIHAMSFHATDKFFVLDVSSGLLVNSTPLQVIVPSAQRPLDFTFSADNQRIIISDYSGALTIWDISSGEAQQTIVWEVPSWFSTIDLAFAPDGSQLAVNYGQLTFFDAQTYEQVSILRDEDRGVGDTIQYGFATEWFVTHQRYATYRFWNDQSELFQLPARASAITFSDDGTFFVTGGVDGTIRVWGVPTRR